MKGTKRFASVICGIAAAVLSAAGIVMMLAEYFILNTERYESHILTDDYYAAVFAARDEGFGSFGSVLDADSERLKSFFPDEACKNLAAEYLHAVFFDLENGTKTANSVSAESDGLKAYLRELFSGYDFSKTGYADSSAAADDAYELVCGKVNSAFRMQDDLMSSVTASLSPYWSALSSAAEYWYAFFAAALLLYAVMSALVPAKRLSARIFGALSSFWCACALCFIPAAVVYSGTSGIGLNFESSAQRYFLDGLLGALRSGLFYLPLAFIAASTAALIAAGSFAARRVPCADEDADIPLAG